VSFTASCELIVQVSCQSNVISISLSSPDRGVVSGGQEHEKSCEEALIDSEMAGPIAMKLSEIDQGKSEHVLGKKN